MQANEKPVAVYASVHPFQLALRWQREIMADSQVTKARIAKREGLSRARVTQIMNLLQLPEVIQRQLQDPPPPLNIRAFSERRLRVLLAQADIGRRLRDWQQWLDELQQLNQECPTADLDCHVGGDQLMAHLGSFGSVELR